MDEQAGNPERSVGPKRNRFFPDLGQQQGFQGTKEQRGRVDPPLNPLTMGKCYTGDSAVTSSLQALP